MVFSAEAWLVAAVLESLETTFNICFDFVGELWWEVLGVIFVSPETVSYPEGSGREFQGMEYPFFLFN